MYVRICVQAKLSLVNLSLLYVPYGHSDTKTKPYTRVLFPSGHYYSPSHPGHAGDTPF